MNHVGHIATYGLDELKIANVNTVYWNHNTPTLYEHIIRRNEGTVAHLGPLAVRTGSHTGRAPKDKFIVREEQSEGKIWWGKHNQPFEIRNFELLYHRLLAYLQGRDLYVQDCYGGADKRFSIPIRIITECAWHSCFARNMFVRPPWLSYKDHKPEFTVIQAPFFQASPDLDGTHSEAFIIVHFGKKLVLIGGTAYAGEIKKSIFSVLNYILPQEHVLSMHCAANLGPQEDGALFFGLSGTGKTTLSSDPTRRLIGDDEHGWGTEGVFNFEGGCYAKIIRLDPNAEADIYQTTRRFGTLLENVAIHPVTRRLDLNDASLTENTRAAYPISHVAGSVRTGVGPHPKNIFFLTLDAFGILPPLARLSPAQAKEYFLIGYTAKTAGTEAGLSAEPEATFSACFGAPFMVLPPPVYAGLLEEKVLQHQVQCWLVNTGWIGGPYGVGKRISIPATRALIAAVLKGDLTGTAFRKDPVFGFEVPESCPGVATDLLNPRGCWENKGDYDEKARALAGRFAGALKEFASR